jgi:hypothetical protein
VVDPIGSGLIPRLDRLGGTSLASPTWNPAWETGLDAQKDEVIELGMVKFDYLSDATSSARPKPRRGQHRKRRRTSPSVHS